MNITRAWLIWAALVLAGYAVFWYLLDVVQNPVGHRAVLIGGVLVVIFSPMGYKNWKGRDWMGRRP